MTPPNTRSHTRVRAGRGRGRGLLGAAAGRSAVLALAAALGAGALAGCAGAPRTGGDDGRNGNGSAVSGDDASARPRLTVSGAFLPEPVTTGMAAGFLVVGNTGGSDALTSVTSDLAARVTLHSTHAGRMAAQGSFTVPAHGRLDFARGGNHLMFEQLTRKPRVGETVTLRLHFRRSGTLTVTVPVKPATYYPNAAATSAAAAGARPPSPQPPTPPPSHDPGGGSWS